MIEMWDQQFFQMNPEISVALDGGCNSTKKMRLFGM
jgi:hypothetical protein